MIEQRSTDLIGWARFSDDQRMRYRLTRILNVNPKYERRVVFVMLNPSTADAFVLDPTVRRCISFARREGADVLEVVNLFALRSTAPEALYREPYIGDDEQADDEILEACIGAGRVVAAWGVHGAWRGRGAAVRSMLESRGVQLHHLGLTKFGHPRHPLYLMQETPLTSWEAAEVSHG